MTYHRSGVGLGAPGERDRLHSVRGAGKISSAKSVVRRGIGRLAIHAAILLASAAHGGERAEPVLSNHPDLFPPDRTCPATSSRAPLLHYRAKNGFEEVREGHRLLVDADSHPRRPARLKSPPTVKRTAGGYEIGFALDGYDDVDIRITDAAGNVVRRLGCGVLGPNAPAPFARDSLAQTVGWDGLDAGGRPAPAGCLVLVSVGLAPRFERFVGYDRESLVPHIVALQVDKKGRVYVATSAETRSDPVMIRLDRDGRYLDMVYPPGPRQLAGRRLEDLYRHAEYIDGRGMVTRARSWSQHIYQWPAGTMLPFRIGPDGKGYVAEILTGYGSADVDWKTTKYRMFRIDDLENFWFLQNIALLPSFGAFAVDGQGSGYLAGRRFDLSKGARSTDPRGLGAIRKVDLATGAPRPDFRWNGTQKLEAPSAYLGAAPGRLLTGNESLPRNTVDNAAIDSDSRFPDIRDLAVDTKGRILVVDGKPRRIKVYEADGRFAGLLDRLVVGGVEKRFAEISALALAGNDIYLIASLVPPPAKTAESTAPGPRPGPLSVLKCSGDILAPAFVWQKEVNSAAQHLAVDAAANPRLVWFANGNGPGTVSRLADRGGDPGDVAHFGGTRERCFRFPLSISTDGEGRLYVYDYVAGCIVRTDETAGQWVETARRDPAQPPAPLGKGPALFVDRVNKLLYSTAHGQEPRVYTLDLKRVADFGLKARDADGKFAWAARSGGTIGGVDSGGSIYVGDEAYPVRKPKKEVTPPPAGTGPSGAADKGKSGADGGGAPRSAPAPADLKGVIRRYGRQGEVLDEAWARLNWGCGSLAVDSRGNVYALDLAPADLWTYVSHNLPCGLTREITTASGGIGPARLMFERGGLPVWHQSDLCCLVKFGPGGGMRNTEAELWAHRGFSPHPGGGCWCDWPRGIVAVDAADRIYAADAVHHHVKVLDTAGNLVARVGWWGNADDVPDDGDASKLGFWNIYSLATASETLYVCDKDLRRIAAIRMAYREAAKARIE